MTSLFLCYDASNLYIVKWNEEKTDEVIIRSQWTTWNYHREIALDRHWTSRCHLKSGWLQGLRQGVAVVCERSPFWEKLWPWKSAIQKKNFENWPWKSGIFEKMMSPFQNPGDAPGLICILTIILFGRKSTKEKPFSLTNLQTAMICRPISSRSAVVYDPAIPCVSSWNKLIPACGTRATTRPMLSRLMSKAFRRFSW
jgi:hypothetical protein